MRPGDIKSMMSMVVVKAVVNVLTALMALLVVVGVVVLLAVLALFLVLAQHNAKAKMNSKTLNIKYTDMQLSWSL